jgi:hypothetical protein
VRDEERQTDRQTDRDRDRDRVSERRRERRWRLTNQIASEKLFAFDIDVLEVVEDLKDRAREKIRQLLVAIAASDGCVFELLTSAPPKSAF